MKVVTIGGGTGQAVILRGLREYNCDLTAIVGVTDAGGYSGVIRQAMDIPQPGDSRSILASLADSSLTMTKLMKYRFSEGDLSGISLGNLMLAAMTRITGNFREAVEELGRSIKKEGKVVPVTNKSTHICAELLDGTIVEGEWEIIKKSRSQIKRLFLKDLAEPNEGVIRAIENADLIVIGPGSLRTGIISVLLAEGVSDAIARSKAKKVYICNIMTHPGQTDEFTSSMHIRELKKYCNVKLDCVLINTETPSDAILEAYRKDGAKQVFIDDMDEVLDKDCRVIKDNFVSYFDPSELQNMRRSTNERMPAFPHFVRHDSKKLTKTLMSLVKPTLKAVILAAGGGSRLKPFSFSDSKVMINFLGRPVLAHHVDEFIKNSICDFVIICNPGNVESVRKYFDENYSHCKFEYAIQEEQLGPAHAINCAKQFLRAGDFIVKYGDSLSSEDQVGALLKMYEADRSVDAVITLRRAKKNLSEYGVAQFENDKLTAILEKPKDPPSDLVNVGLWVLKGSTFFEAFDKVGFDTVLTPPEYILRANGKTSYWIADAHRVDLGRPWNILDANKLLIDKLGGCIESQRVSSSANISKKAYVGSDAVIGDGVIIGDYSSVNCFVSENSIIEHSVIMDGSKIGKNCVVRLSVIGKNNVIEDSFKTSTNFDSISVYVKDSYVQTGLKELGLFTGANVVIREASKSYPGKVIFPNKIISGDISEDFLIRAVVFDADNTIYKTKSIAKGADFEAMKYFSTQTDVGPEELYAKWKSIVNTLKNEKDPAKRHRSYSYKLLAKEYNLNGVDLAFKMFLKKLIDSIQLVEGFEKIPPRINRFSTAVITEDSSDLAIPKLSKFGLDKVFDKILTSDSVGIMKPDERYYKKIFKIFGVAPRECLFVGDKFEEDLSIPKKLGAVTVFYGTEAEKRAHYSINNYEKLLELLKRY